MTKIRVLMEGGLGDLVLFPIGPAIIGYLAHTFDLMVSFVAFALAGIMVIPISKLFLNRHRTVA